MPSCRSGVTCRAVSPAGGSTLMTSAPESPSSWVAVGPMTTEVMSMTRRPSSAPAIWLPFRLVGRRERPQPGLAVLGVPGGLECLHPVLFEDFLEPPAVRGGRLVRHRAGQHVVGASDRPPGAPPGRLKHAVNGRLVQDDRRAGHP